MAQSSSLASIIAAACNAAKVETINGLPAMPVSGDVGVGFFCVPDSVDDLAFLQNVNEKARGFTLVAVLRAAMQKAQGKLKAFDKKNKDASTEARLQVAQSTFAGAINGSADMDFQESGAITGEALRMFKAELQPQVAANRPAPLVTDDAFMDTVLADIAKNRKADYDAKVASLVAKVSEARTYVVSRKGEKEVASVNTSALTF